MLIKPQRIGGTEQAEVAPHNFRALIVARTWDDDERPSADLLQN